MERREVQARPSTRAKRAVVASSPTDLGFLSLRFQADADLDFDIVAGVLRREPAIDFQSAQESIPDGTPDADVLAAAAREDRILVSHDVSTMPSEFFQFMEHTGESPGEFVLPQSVPLSAAIEELLLIWSVSTSDDWRNRLVWLPL